MKRIGLLIMIKTIRYKIMQNFFSQGDAEYNTVKSIKTAEKCQLSSLYKFIHYNLNLFSQNLFL